MSSLSDLENEPGTNLPVNVEELTKSDSSASYLFDEPLAQRLPLELMHWEDFERLCAQLVEATGNDVQQAFRYGRPQQGQGGIDILAVRRHSDKKLVVECKRIKRLSKGGITKWVDRVLARQDLSEIDEFILAITIENLDNNKKLADEWAAAAARLIRCHVARQLWHFEKLQDLLRLQPAIVARFFGREGARRFCSVALPQEYWPAEYASQKVSDRALENRSVRLDMFPPEEGRAQISATLSFARADLSGISLAIDGQTLTSWMQWAAHASNTEEAPFLPRMPRESRHMLQAPTARLQLTTREAEEFRWVLKEGWLRYIQATQRLDELWHASRFPRMSDDEFGVCKVERWFWRAILAYARDFDYEKGESDQHVFDSAPGCLKVFVGSRRGGLQPGYHLIVYGHSRDGHALHESSVTLCWRPLANFGDQRLTYSPDRAWDVEYAHEWLMKTLFPKVLNWVKDTERRPVSFLNRLRGLDRTNSSRDVRVEDVGFSLARAPFLWTALQLRDRDEAVRLVRGLQSHFTIYQGIAPVEEEVRRRILHLVVYLLPQTATEEHGYIRGNLGIQQNSLTDGLQALMERSVQERIHGAALDMPLRSLIAALETAAGLTPAQLQYVTRELSLVWKRWWEDLSREAYS